jgi:hypothetical protein
VRGLVALSRFVVGSFWLTFAWAFVALEQPLGHALDMLPVSGRAAQVIAWMPPTFGLLAGIGGVVIVIDALRVLVWGE